MAILGGRALSYERNTPVRACCVGHGFDTHESNNISPGRGQKHIGALIFRIQSSYSLPLEPFFHRGGPVQDPVLTSRLYQSLVRRLSTTPECRGGRFIQKRGYPRSPFFKATTLKGKLTFGDPFLDSGVAGSAAEREGDNNKVPKTFA